MHERLTDTLATLLGVNDDDPDAAGPHSCRADSQQAILDEIAAEVGVSRESATHGGRIGAGGVVDETLEVGAAMAGGVSRTKVDAASAKNAANLVVSRCRTDDDFKRGCWSHGVME